MVKYFIVASSKCMVGCKTKKGLASMVGCVLFRSCCVVNYRGEQLESIYFWNAARCNIDFCQHNNEGSNRVGRWISSMYNRKFIRTKRHCEYSYMGNIFISRYRNVFSSIQTLAKKKNASFCSIFAFGIHTANDSVLINKNNVFLDALYTIEISFILPVILGFIVLLIYLGFYVCDRVVIEEAVRETSIYSSQNYSDNFGIVKSEAREKFNEITDGRLFSVSDIEFNIDKEGTYIVVSANGKFVIPMFSDLRRAVFSSDLTIAAVGKGIITRPVGTIYTIEFIGNILRGDD